jgi:hypothetical protein
MQYLATSALAIIDTMQNSAKTNTFFFIVPIFLLLCLKLLLNRFDGAKIGCFSASISVFIPLSSKVVATGARKSDKKGVCPQNLSDSVRKYFGEF